MCAKICPIFSWNDKNHSLPAYAKCWRFKKSLAHQVCQKSETLTLLTTRPLGGHHVTCKGSSYTKNEYNMLNIFLWDNFFEKSSLFWESCKKLFWVNIWQFLTPKIIVNFFLSQMRYWILSYLAIFSKKKLKNLKVRFYGQVEAYRTQRKSVILVCKFLFQILILFAPPTLLLVHKSVVFKIFLLIF